MITMNILLLPKLITLQQFQLAIVEYSEHVYQGDSKVQKFSFIYFFSMGPSFFIYLFIIYFILIFVMGPPLITLTEHDVSSLSHSILTPSKMGVTPGI